MSKHVKKPEAPTEALPDLKRILFEPVAPYFADSYTTLVSVVQGLALGVFGLEIDRLFFQNPATTVDWNVLTVQIAGKLMLIFLFVCLLWHRYIVHTQFYAWEISPLDTIIPIFFGLLEVAAVLAVSKAMIYTAFLFSCMCTLGVVAYINAVQRYSNPPGDPTALKLYKNHFATFGPDFGEALFWEVTRFEKRSQIELITGALLLWASTAAFLWLKNYETVADCFFFVICFLIQLRLMFSNMWRHLKSAPSLKQYWTELEQRHKTVT